MDERLSVPVQRRREGKPSRSVGAMGAGGWKSSRWRGQPTFFLTSKGFRTVSGYDQARERGQGRQNLQIIRGVRTPSIKRGIPTMSTVGTRSAT